MKLTSTKTDVFPTWVRAGFLSCHFQLGLMLMVVSMGLIQSARGQSPPPVASSPAVTSLATTGTTESRAEVVKREMNAAIARVQQIVNQPVRKFRLGPNMQYQIFTEGWFHEGAAKPDFNTVDIRPLQESSYEKYQYVTSPLNPGISFHGPDLGFNPQTKYFVTDRTTPKKKLTEAEMIEINGLYRIIGRSEAELNALLNPIPQPTVQVPVSAPSATSATPSAKPHGVENMVGKLILGSLALVVCYLVLRRMWS